MARIHQNIILQIFFVVCSLCVGVPEHQSRVSVESKYPTFIGNTDTNQPAPSYPFSSPYHAIIVPLAKVNSETNISPEIVPFQEQSPLSEESLPNKHPLQNSLSVYNPPNKTVNEAEVTLTNVSDEDLPPTLHKIPYDTFPEIRKPKNLTSKTDILKENTRDCELTGDCGNKNSIEQTSTNKDPEESMNNGMINHNNRLNYKRHSNNHLLNKENSKIKKLDDNPRNDYDLKLHNNSKINANDAIDGKNSEGSSKKTESLSYSIQNSNDSEKSTSKQNTYSLSYSIKNLNDSEKNSSKRNTHSVSFEGYEDKSSRSKGSARPSLNVNLSPKYVCDGDGRNCKCLKKVQQCVRNAKNFADYLAMSAYAALSSLGEFD